MSEPCIHGIADKSWCSICLSIEKEIEKANKEKRKKEEGIELK